MSDFISIIAFVAAYGVGRFVAPAAAIYLATGAMMLVALGQILWQWRSGKPFSPKEKLTLGAILLLGTITLVFRTPMVVKLKPTIVNLLIGSFLLLSPRLLGQNYTEKMLASAFRLPPALWHKLNLAWVAFFYGEALLNALVAYNFSETFWLGFKLWGLLGLSLVFIAGQFWLLRAYLVREEAP